MRRLMYVLVVTIALAGTAISSAQASHLSLKEAKEVAVQQGSKSMQSGYYWTDGLPTCKRLAPSRVRCAVVFVIETYWHLKECTSRIEVTKRAKSRARTAGTKCRKLGEPFLSPERATDAAFKAFDPNARKYTMSGGSSYGRNRIEVFVRWELEGETCAQIARVRLVDRKVLVNVTEVSCVPTPDWPTAQ